MKTYITIMFDVNILLWFIALAMVVLLYNKPLFSTHLNLFGEATNMQSPL